MHAALCPYPRKAAKVLSWHSIICELQSYLLYRPAFWLPFGCAEANKENKLGCAAYLRMQMYKYRKTIIIYTDLEQTKLKKPQLEKLGEKD